MFHFENSKAAMKTLMRQRFLYPFIFLLFSYPFSNIADVPFVFSFLWFLICGILWVIFYPRYYYNFVKRNANKMIKEGKNDGLLGEHHMTLSEEGIIEFTVNGETKVNWAGIKYLKEDNFYFYLYNSVLSAFILPNKELNSVEKLRNYLEKKIS